MTQNPSELAAFLREVADCVDVALDRAAGDHSMREPHLRARLKERATELVKELKDRPSRDGVGGEGYGASERGPSQLSGATEQTDVTVGPSSTEPPQAEATQTADWGPDATLEVDRAWIVLQRAINCGWLVKDTTDLAQLRGNIRVGLDTEVRAGGPFLDRTPSPAPTGESAEHPMAGELNILILEELQSGSDEVAMMMAKARDELTRQFHQLQQQAREIERLTQVVETAGRYMIVGYHEHPDIQSGCPHVTVHDRYNNCDAKFFKQDSWVRR